ncbi:MAG: DUF424 family protein [Candidatus Woesearchaeota archaeon]|nr:DUF424 family protein [Candidatus Woesearchaeota archaeon]
MPMLVKIHKKESRTIIAVCDKDLLGKLFEENGKQLDLRGEFYKGEELEIEEIGDLIRNADGVNLVGQEAINLGLQEGVIGQENIIIIKGIPHAQAILIHE